MKKSVLQRSLFAGAAPKQESKGIISGFDEELEMEGFEERTPDSLEIIANNLRGDMRSMDERYLELAQMVGDAAFETPEEVVTLMQAQMAQPAMDQGIAAAGAPVQAPPPGGIMSNIAPQMPPQMPQQPMQMAQGGLVYRQTGSPPGGETARRNLGFMRYLPAGTIPAASEVPPRSVPIPRVELGQIPSVGGRTPVLSAQAAELIRSGALSSSPLQAVPQQIPATLRFSTAASEAMRGAIPFTRELGRTIMATPQGKGAALIGTASLGALPLLMGGNKPPGDNQPPKDDIRYSEVPGVDAEGRYRPMLPSVENMPGTPEEKRAIREVGFMPIEGLGMGTIGKGPTPAEVLGVTEPEGKPVEAPRTTVTPPPANRTQEFRDRVKEKMDIYKEFLGDDPEFRKAQALFLLAESALNVAGATGRSTGERLAKGLKGLPAGMAAIGAEAEKARRGIAAAAISAVESELADARKFAATIAREQIRKGAGSAKVNSLFSSIKARMPNMDDDVAYQLATDMDNGTVKPNEKTGEFVDSIQGTVRWSPHRPLNTNSIGYIDPNQPFTRTMDTTLEPATLSEREDLLKKRVALQKRIEGNNDMLKLIYGDTVGFLPTIGSGVSQLTLSVFGDVGLGLTDVQKNQIRDRLQLNREELIKANLRNAGRPAVYDQKKMEGVIRDPNAFFASPQLLIANVSNLQREDINELARIDSQLFGVPLKQLDRVPVGSKTDPIPITPNSQLLLEQTFKNRPQMGIWVTRPDGVTERITSQQFFSQQRKQQ